MKKLLNILYVSTQGCYLSKEGDTVLILKQNEKLAQIPFLNLQGIVCFGNVLVSPFLMGACAEQGIALSFLTANGRFLSRIQGGVCGNILLRKAQYRQSMDPVFCGRHAAMFLLGKILNSRSVLKRFLRDHGEELNASDRDFFECTVSEMKITAVQLGNELRSSSCPSLDELRGREGHLANLYFQCFRSFLPSAGEFRFENRSRRPPLDRVNAMLSFAYTLLAHDCCAALETVGLDPAAGFFHADRPGRFSLALDLMEELRAYMADRLVVSLINRHQVRACDFKVTETGAVRMNDDFRKILIGAWQDRKQELILHPYLNESIKIGMIPFMQSLLLARCIRGELDHYPPFFIR